MILLIIPFLIAPVTAEDAGQDVQELPLGWSWQVYTPGQNFGLGKIPVFYEDEDEPRFHTQLYIYSAIINIPVSPRSLLCLLLLIPIGAVLVIVFKGRSDRPPDNDQ